MTILNIYKIYLISPENRKKIFYAKFYLATNMILNDTGYIAVSLVYHFTKSWQFKIFLLTWGGTLAVNWLGGGEQDHD